MGDLNLLTLEVDGSLSNPRVLCAVVIWTALLSLVGTSGGRWLRIRRMASMLPVALFVVLSFVTSRAQLFIAEALYILTSRSGITSVGFWGSPPAWIAPVAASGVVLAAWWRTSRPRTRGAGRTSMPL